MMRFFNIFSALIILSTLISPSVSGQDNDFISVQIEPELIESGDYTNFYKFDLTGIFIQKLIA